MKVCIRVVLVCQGVTSYKQYEVASENAIVKSFLFSSILNWVAFECLLNPSCFLILKKNAKKIC